MNVYVGTKILNAQPMTRGDYNIFRGWTLPDNEKGCEDDAGYLVEYLDQGAGTEANTPHFQGFVSWSPKDIFENAYTRISSLTFGVALELCKQGYRIARAGWNKGGQYVQMINPAAPHVDNLPKEDEALARKLVERPGLFNAMYQIHDNNPHAPGTMRPWLGIKTADNQFMPWAASQSDMLWNDWMVVTQADIEAANIAALLS